MVIGTIFNIVSIIILLISLHITMTTISESSAIILHLKKLEEEYEARNKAFSNESRNIK